MFERTLMNSALRICNFKIKFNGAVLIEGVFSRSSHLLSLSLSLFLCLCLVEAREYRSWERGHLNIETRLRGREV